MSKISSGKLGEDIACKLLLNNGYKIITKNFHSKLGEIDIVAIDQDTLVFVEVKTRWSEKFGKPEEAVTLSKLAKIKRTGEYFCLLKPDYPKKQRIDVVAIEMEKGRVVSQKIIKVD